ncbi:MAG: Gfo/Idh/MocA family oxidoreductase [Pirellulales bacterium]|nr:Gfo/Idh/MocA family oxidoreductase [Pirellulales bacterium]
MASKQFHTRRRFLAQVAQGAAAGCLTTFVPSTVLGRDGGTAANSRIGVGIIGLGRQCVGRNLPVFMRRKDCKVTAICDVDRWRLQVPNDPAILHSAKSNKWDIKTLADCFRTTDFRKLLDRKDVDAVMISTPDHWHIPIALASIKAGKDVCCEKPFGLAIAHGRVLADAAAKSKCVFRTDSEFRSIPHLFKAVSLVRTGKIGKLKTVRISVPIYWDSLPMQPDMPVPEDLDYDMWLGPAPKVAYTEKRVHPPKTYGRPGWYSNRDYCDGMICNWGYHPADIAQWGNNTERTGPVEVEGSGTFPPKDYLWNVITEFEVRYRYANGVEMFYAGRKDFKDGQSYMRFEGTEGWVCGWYGPDRLEAEPKSLLTADVKPEDFPFPLKNEKHDFLDCIHSRGQTLEDAEVGQRSSSIGQLGYIACQLGRKLKWDPDKEQFPGDEEANKLVHGVPGRKPWNVM